MEGQHEKQGAKVVIMESMFAKPGQLGQTDILSDIFPPKPHLKYTEWHGYGGQSLIAPASTFADESCKNEASKRCKVCNKKSTEITAQGEVSNPCNYCSTAVDHGAQDDESNPVDESNPDNGKTCEGFYYPDPKHTRGEWWQGSLYY